MTLAGATAALHPVQSLEALFHRVLPEELVITGWPGRWHPGRLCQLVKSADRSPDVVAKDSLLVLCVGGGGLGQPEDRPFWELSNRAWPRRVEQQAS